MSKNEICHIDIGEDFAKYLGGRNKTDGEHSGEEFLEILLEPAFLEYGEVVIHLDSLEGPTAGFFEEAFGGLVRKYGHGAVTAKIRFESEKRTYLIRKILEWMKEADTQRAP